MQVFGWPSRISCLSFKPHASSTKGVYQMNLLHVSYSRQHFFLLAKSQRGSFSWHKNELVNAAKNPLNAEVVTAFQLLILTASLCSGSIDCSSDLSQLPVESPAPVWHCSFCDTHPRHLTLSCRQIWTTSFVQIGFVNLIDTELLCFIIFLEATSVLRSASSTDWTQVVVQTLLKPVKK